MPVKDAQLFMVKGCDEWQEAGGTRARDEWLASKPESVHQSRIPEKCFSQQHNDSNRKAVVILCPHPAPVNMVRFHSVFTSRY
jgi:hypothetical protein